MKVKVQLNKNDYIPKLQLELLKKQDSIISLMKELEHERKEKEAALGHLKFLRKMTGWVCFQCYYDENYERSICESCTDNDYTKWTWCGIEGNDDV